MVAEVEVLDRETSDERQVRWTRLPKHSQRLWLSMLVARCRAMREQPSCSMHWMLIKGVIARFAAWAKTNGPGHVNGMQLKHTPVHGSWVDDASNY